MRTKDFTNRLSDRRRQQLGELARFGVVGLTATAIQYGTYWLLLRLLTPTPAMTLAYAVSFAFNFYASTHFTFRVSANARRGAGFALSHIVNYLLQMVLLNVFIALGVSKQLAPIPMFCICVPVNFILVRFFLKR